jgi:hypothetical protein
MKNFISLIIVLLHYSCTHYTLIGETHLDLVQLNKLYTTNFIYLNKVSLIPNALFKYLKKQGVFITGNIAEYNYTDIVEVKPQIPNALLINGGLDSSGTFGYIIYEIGGLPIQRFFLVFNVQGTYICYQAYPLDQDSHDLESCRKVLEEKTDAIK